MPCVNFSLSLPVVWSDNFNLQVNGSPFCPPASLCGRQFCLYISICIYTSYGPPYIHNMRSAEGRAAERRYPMSKVRSGGHEEVHHVRGLREIPVRQVLREGIRGQTDWNLSHRKLANLITRTTALSNSMKLSHAVERLLLNYDTRILGPWRRRIQSRARDKAWSLRAFV